MVSDENARPLQYKTWQKEPEKKYCNFENFNRAVVSKAGIKRNGVQIFRICLENVSKCVGNFVLLYGLSIRKVLDRITFTLYVYYW